MLKYIKTNPHPSLSWFTDLSWSLSLLRLVLSIIEIVSFYARYFFVSRIEG